MARGRTSIFTRAPHPLRDVAALRPNRGRPPLSAQRGPAEPAPTGLKILHVSQPTEAGVANVLLAYAEDQVRRGWDCHVASPEAGTLARAVGELGATHHPWDAERAPGRTVFAEARSLRRIVADVRPDVVHLHSSKAGLAGRLAVRGSRPIVFEPHAWSFEATSGTTRAGSLAWERWARRWTTTTLCVSDAEADLGRRYGVLPQRWVVVHNGVDLTRWRPQNRAEARTRLGLSPDVPVVVLVGRLTAQKGQDLALRALPAIRVHVPSTQLHLVGDGPDRAALERRTGDGAHVVGGVADPRDWYAAADVVLVPSLWEGMPLVVLEAMACGAAVVATDVAGVREALGEGVPVVKPGEFMSLVVPVVDLLRRPEIRAAQGRANRLRTEALFDVRRSCEDVATLLTSMARQGLRG